MTNLSVIIPTLNEALYLPHLLAALHRQSCPPAEIIVADAGSHDGTIELARAAGAQVVPGGMPGAGRNAGARAARGEIFLFLDADVVPAPAFIACVLAEFEHREYGVATCPTEALSDQMSDRLIMHFANLYQRLVLPVSPRAAGYCVLARRSVHEAIGGFDETLAMSEDHDYARRAAQHGTFGLLTSTRIPVSVRRFEKEGIMRLALKYSWCEIYTLAGKPIRTKPFAYEFGAYPPVPAKRQRVAGRLRSLRRAFGIAPQQTMI